MSPVCVYKGGKGGLSLRVRNKADLLLINNRFLCQCQVEGGILKYSLAVVAQYFVCRA